MSKWTGKLLLLWGAWMMVAGAASGQSSRGSESASTSIDAALTFNASYNNNVPGDTFWMQGGNAQVHTQLWRGLGAVVDVGGLHNANVNNSGVGLDIVTVAFGPRYTWGPRYGRYSFFGQVLGGEAFGVNSVFPMPAGTDSSAESSALILGGGVTIRVSRRFSVRALEAEWQRTQLPNATTGVQNSLRLGAGVIFRIR
jgi:hypothetical protein